MLLLFITLLPLLYGFDIKDLLTGNTDLVRLPANPCLEKTLVRIKANCYELDPESRKRLVFEILNCFNQYTGRTTFNCSWDQSVTECTRMLEGSDVETYHNLFFRIEDICLLEKGALFQNKLKDILDENDEITAFLEDISSDNQIKTERVRKKQKDIMARLHHETLELSPLIKSTEEAVKEACQLRQTQKNIQKDLLKEIKYYETTVVSSFLGALEELYVASAQYIRTADEISAGIWYIIFLALIYSTTQTPALEDQRGHAIRDILVAYAVERVFNYFSGGENFRKILLIGRIGLFVLTGWGFYKRTKEYKRIYVQRALAKVKDLEDISRKINAFSPRFRHELRVRFRQEYDRVTRDVNPE